MLGRKGYTTDEIVRARTVVDHQLAAFRGLPDPGGFETEFANGLVITVDRFFVHRVRTFTGKDTNPLSEVELIVDSLIGNDGVFRAGSVVKWSPDRSVTGLKPGDTVVLTADAAAELAAAFLAEIEKRGS